MSIQTNGRIPIHFLQPFLIQWHAAVSQELAIACREHLASSVINATSYHIAHTETMPCATSNVSDFIVLHRSIVAVISKGILGASRHGGCHGKLLGSHPNGNAMIRMVHLSHGPRMMTTRSCRGRIFVGESSVFIQNMHFIVGNEAGCRTHDVSVTTVRRWHPKRHDKGKPGDSTIVVTRRFVRFAVVDLLILFRLLPNLSYPPPKQAFPKAAPYSFLLFFQVVNDLLFRHGLWSGQRLTSANRSALKSYKACKLDCRGPIDQFHGAKKRFFKR
mmetsp:Transcript_16476/g.31317  ORF Transcript_16476/g.31317 Transcript_16476/m.31317 type:complete len:274 (+) Transcript_16476:401-1222(+)